MKALHFLYFFVRTESCTCYLSRAAQQKICWVCPRCNCDHREFWCCSCDSRLLCPSSLRTAACGVQTCSLPFFNWPVSQLGHCTGPYAVEQMCWQWMCVCISVEDSLFLIGHGCWWGDWPSFHCPSVTAWYKWSGHGFKDRILPHGHMHTWQYATFVAYRQARPHKHFGETIIIMGLHMLWSCVSVRSCSVVIKACKRFGMC